MTTTPSKHSTKIAVHLTEPLEISLGKLLKPINNDDFLTLSRENQDVQIEMNKDGDLIIMPGTGGLTGSRNSNIIAELVNWAKKDKCGIVFDSDTIFQLPNNARRIPDASWVRNEKWNSLTKEEKEKIVPFAPDFVIELRSPSDALEDLREKMREYIENGTQLGWLIDPQAKRVFVYRPDQEAVILESPADISGEPVLKGFTLSLLGILDRPRQKKPPFEIRNPV